MENVKGEENLIVMGDLNITGEEEKIKNLIGKYGLEKWNDRRDRLLKCWAKYNSIVTNTCFKFRSRR